MKLLESLLFIAHHISQDHKAKPEVYNIILPICEFPDHMCHSMAELAGMCVQHAGSYMPVASSYIPQSAVCSTAYTTEATKVTTSIT